MLVDRYLPALRQAKAARVARRAHASRGERVMGSLFPGRGLSWPGGWSEDRAAQVAHMTNWVYCAIDTICCKVAAISPNLAYVSTEERPGVTEKAGYRSLHASSKYLVGRYGGTAFLEDYPVGQGRAYDLQRVLPFPRGLSGHTIGFSEGGHSWLTMGAYRSKALSVVKPHEELEPLEHDHPLRRLVDNPNPYDTAFDLEYELQMFEELTGVSFEWLVPNRFGMPCERWCLPSHWVWPRTGGGRNVDPNDPDAHRLIWYYEVRPWGGAYGMSGVLRIPADEIVMTRWKSPLDKIGGHAKTAAIAQWIDSEESVGRSRWAQFMNVARPEFWVQLGPGYEDPDDDRIARIEAKFASKYQGEYNYGKPIITPPGSVLTPLSFNPTEMSYMGSEEQLRDMILSAWRVPPAAVGIVKEMTYGSILATLGSLCSFCINPRLAMRGQVRTKHLASRWDEPDGPAWSQGYSLTEEGKAVGEAVVKTSGYGGRGVGRRVRFWYDDCLDPETECLTDRGWKRQEELTAETRIACYDDETDTIVYRRPRRIIRRHHDGVLYVWEGGRVNAAMTPRHRVYVQSRPKTNRPVPVWGFRLAGDLQGSSLDYRVRRAALAACDVPAAVLVDRYVGWHQRNLGEVGSIDPKLWLEFLGYYLSEGNLERNKGPDKGAWLITIAQGEDNANFQRMAECIGAMPFGDWKTYRKRHKKYGDKYIQFVCTDRGLYEHLIVHCGNGSALKRVPDYVKSWPAADLRVLLDALIAGDGRRPYTTASTGVWNSAYTTVSSQLADDVMEIAVKCGIAASITRHEPAKPHQSPYYVVNLSSRIVVSVLPTRRRVVSYSGLVWCVEVPTGKFVVRRGGMAHITGNCVPADPDQVNSDITVDMQCVLPGQELQGRVIGGSKARYAGEAIEVIARSGAVLFVTPNHPIVTVEGLVPAGDLQEGQYLLRYIGSNESPAKNNVQNAPAVVEEVFRTLTRVFDASVGEVPCTPIEFHGDAAGFNGKVQVVGSYGELRRGLVPESRKCGDESRLVRLGLVEGTLGHFGQRGQVGIGNSPALEGGRDVGCMRLGELSTLEGGRDALAGSGPSSFRAQPVPPLSTNGLASLGPGGDGGLHLGTVHGEFASSRGVPDLDTRCSALLPQPHNPDPQVGGDLVDGLAPRVGGGNPVHVGSRLGKQQSLCFGPAADLDVSLAELVAERGCGDAQFPGEGGHSLPAEVTLDQVVKVRKFHYDGPVYDFESPLGFIVIGSLCVSNCNAITPNEVRALRGRKGYRKGGDDPIVQGPGGPMPLPLNTGEAADLEGLAELIAPMTQAGKGEEQGEQGGGPAGPLGQGPGAEPLPESSEGRLPGEEGTENATGLEPPEEPNGPPGKGWRIRKATGRYAEGTSPEYDADPTLVVLATDFLEKANGEKGPGESR